ncbi:MAG: hypothetical protein ACXVDD_02225, partial [Polyangia bacterium]
MQLDHCARLGDRRQVDLAIPGLQQREVLGELRYLRVIERDAELRRAGNQPLFRCLVQSLSVLFRRCRILAPKISRTPSFPSLS